MTVRQELVTNNPAQFPTFEECYEQAQRSFVDGAYLWTQARLPHLALPDQFVTGSESPIFFNGTRDAVLSFDDRILSGHFHKIKPQLRQARKIILWSQIDKAAQDQETGVIKQALGQGFIRGPIPEFNEIIARDKFGGESAQIFAEILSREIGMGRERGRSRSIQVVVIEDKLTNMMRLMREFIALGGIDMPKVSIDIEEDLDRENFDDKRLVSEWVRIIAAYPNYFSSINFLYTPPEKAEAAGLRQNRIKMLFAGANKSLSNSNLKEQFFHIDDVEAKRLPKVLPRDSFVVADISGPLVSKKKVLETREETLRVALGKLVAQIYEDIYGRPVEDIARFIVDQKSDFLLVDSKGVQYTQLPSADPKASGILREAISRVNYKVRVFKYKHNELDESKISLSVHLAEDIRRGAIYDILVDLDQYRAVIKSLGLIV